MAQSTGSGLTVPLLIRIAGVFAGFWASIVCVVLLALVAMIGLDTGSFEFNGEPVSREEFAQKLPLMAAALGTPAIYLGAVALGIWRGRAWVRPAVLVFWLLVSVGLVLQGVLGMVDLVLAVASSIAYITFVAWYFYFKPNVVNYYRSLQNPVKRTSETSDRIAAV